MGNVMSAVSGPLNWIVTGDSRPGSLASLTVSPPIVAEPLFASAARYVAPLPFPDYLGLDAYATGERGL